MGDPATELIRLTQDRRRRSDRDVHARPPLPRRTRSTAPPPTGPASGADSGPACSARTDARPVRPATPADRSFSRSRIRSGDRLSSTIASTGKQKRLLQLILPRHRGVTHLVGERHPGRARRELERFLLARLLKAASSFIRSCSCSISASYGGPPRLGHAERLQERGAARPRQRQRGREPRRPRPRSRRRRATSAAALPGSRSRTRAECGAPGRATPESCRRAAGCRPCATTSAARRSPRDESWRARAATRPA